MTALDALYLPLAVSAAFIAFAPTRDRPAPAGIAVACGCLMGLLLVRTMPIWPPIGGIGYLPYMLLAGLVSGLFADRPRYRFGATLFFCVAMPIIVTLLVATETYRGGPWGSHNVIIPLLALSGIYLFSRLVRAGPRFSAGRALFFANAGLTAIAFLYGSRLGLHALSTTAAIMGTILALSTLGPRWSLSASFVAGAAWFTLATTMILTRDLLAFPTALTGLALLVPHTAASLSGDNRQVRFGLELVMGSLIAICAPAALLMGTIN